MIAAIVVAAGTGSRAGGSLPKQFQDLGGVPLIVRSVWALERSGEVGRVLVALPGELMDYARREIFGAVTWEIPPELVEGGAERWESVERCLQRLAPPVEHVLVHDGARPLVSAELVRRVCVQVRQDGAVLAALPEKNTLKRVSGDGWVSGTVDRREIWEAQTPQAFRLELLKEAYAKARETNFIPTDDAALVERLGYPVKIVPGEEANFKVTTPFDMELARLLLAAARETPAC